MLKEEARKQFDVMTEQLGIVHTFSFDEAWDYVEYKKGQSLIHQPVSFLPANYTKEQFQEGIMKVETIMMKNKRVLKGESIEKTNPLKHSFADGCYVREIFNPGGSFLVTKIHKVSHPYFLLKGSMTIMSEEGEKRIQAPHYGITKAGTKRIIYTHEDCVFVTVHATNETDIEKIEEEVISKDFREG
jgi:hypothetical protein